RFPTCLRSVTVRSLLAACGAVSADGTARNGPGPDRTAAAASPSRHAGRLLAPGHTGHQGDRNPRLADTTRSPPIPPAESALRLGQLVAAARRSRGCSGSGTQLPATVSASTDACPVARGSASVVDSPGSTRGSWKHGAVLRRPTAPTPVPGSVPG